MRIWKGSHSRGNFIKKLIALTLALSMTVLSASEIIANAITGQISVEEIASYNSSKSYVEQLREEIEKEVLEIHIILICRMLCLC
ncbi:MAG: hypothetical protein J6A75_09230 [Lachnospiraceae bacterium]|nr:hypothetical protein [Lachnospiraceae bacterium]